MTQPPPSSCAKATITEWRVLLPHCAHWYIVRNKNHSENVVYFTHKPTHHIHRAYTEFTFSHILQMSKKALQKNRLRRFEMNSGFKSLMSKHCLLLWQDQRAFLILEILLSESGLLFWLTSPYFQLLLSTNRWLQLEIYILEMNTILVEEYN